MDHTLLLPDELLREILVVHLEQEYDLFTSGIGVESAFLPSERYEDRWLRERSRLRRAPKKIALPLWAMLTANLVCWRWNNIITGDRRRIMEKYCQVLSHLPHHNHRPFAFDHIWHVLGAHGVTREVWNHAIAMRSRKPVGASLMKRVMLNAITCSRVSLLDMCIERVSNEYLGHLLIECAHHAISANSFDCFKWVVGALDKRSLLTKELRASMCQQILELRDHPTKFFSREFLSHASIMSSDDHYHGPKSVSKLSIEANAYPVITRLVQKAQLADADHKETVARLVAHAQAPMEAFLKNDNAFHMSMWMSLSQICRAVQIGAHMLTTGYTPTALSLLTVIVAGAARSGNIILLREIRDARAAASAASSCGLRPLVSNPSEVAHCIFIAIQQSYVDIETCITTVTLLKDLLQVGDDVFLDDHQRHSVVNAILFTCVRDPVVPSDPEKVFRQILLPFLCSRDFDNGLILGLTVRPVPLWIFQQMVTHVPMRDPRQFIRRLAELLGSRAHIRCLLTHPRYAHVFRDMLCCSRNETCNCLLCEWNNRWCRKRLMAALMDGMTKDTTPYLEHVNLEVRMMALYYYHKYQSAKGVEFAPRPGVSWPHKTDLNGKYLMLYALYHPTADLMHMEFQLDRRFWLHKLYFASRASRATIAGYIAGNLRSSRARHFALVRMIQENHPPLTPSDVTTIQRLMRSKMFTSLDKKSFAWMIAMLKIPL